MGKSSGGGSSGYDPAAAASAQGAANKDAVRESALVNQVNQVGPFGQQTWSGSIGSPDRTVTTSLTPEGQQQLDLQNQIGTDLLGVGANNLVPQAQSALGQPLDFSGLQQISGAGDLQNQAAGLEQATYQRGLNLLQPQIDQQTRQEYTRLANQGLPEGGKAFDTAIGNLRRDQGNALENLSLSSVAAGRQEQSRLSALEQGIRQQQMNEQLTQRSQPINELSALLQGAPAIGLPQYSQPSQYAVQSPDLLGAYGLSAQLGQQQQNNNSALWGAGIGALGSIGGGLLGGGYI